MVALAEIQERISCSILQAPGADLLTIVRGGQLSPQRRIGVHRNHFQISLAQALSTTFPATRALVGGNFFEQTARRFALEHPPVGPCLFEYGAELPAYFDRLPALRDLPYLGDLARFEWCLNVVHHAPDHRVLDPARIAGLRPNEAGSLRFTLVPTVRLYASRYPILKIWRLAKGETEEEISLEAGGNRLLIQRRDDKAVWREIQEAEYCLLNALQIGARLAESVPTDLDLDLAASLGVFFRDGVFLDFQVDALPPSGN